MADAIVILLCFLLTVVALVFWWRDSRKAKKFHINLESVKARLQATEQALEETQQNLTTAQESLQRYQPIIDVEGEAARLRNEAESLLQEAKNEADAILNEAGQNKRAAKEVLAAATAKADEQIQAAYQKSAVIEAAAYKKAEEIAGEAFAAQGKVKEYEQALKALKNAVDGYGDEYIKPSESVLDGLAEDFGFTEAGQKFKDARAYSKRLIKDNAAATCDYVEDYRRKTAIAFVVDAFNGKVDSILAKVKTDNFGKLEQEINDAFSLVNLNGKAFRDARILPIYKDARMAELRWGVAVMVLREQEREEQRAIKERMREEERARREYERAMREAAKDEERLQTAMQKAREELAKASEAQKSKYEAQLAELEAKLREAEAKSQRALSMAQQTRSGHVYVISNIGSFGEDVFKIGMTRRLEPQDRVRELGDASVPFAFDVHAMIYSEDAPALENELHKRFNELRVNKVNPRKEFFRLGLTAIRDAAHEIGVTANFTMLAQAQEYRETLALEKLSPQELEHRMQGLLNKEVLLHEKEDEEDK